MLVATIFIVLLVAFMMEMFYLARPEKIEPVEHRGTIAALNAGNGTVTIGADGETHEFVVIASTKIYVGGRECPFADLRKGDPVAIRSANGEALEIRAMPAARR